MLITKRLLKLQYVNVRGFYEYSCQIAHDSERWLQCLLSQKTEKMKRYLLDCNDSDLSDSDNKNESLLSDEFSFTSSESEDEQ